MHHALLCSAHAQSFLQNHSRCHRLFRKWTGLSSSLQRHRLRGTWPLQLAVGATKAGQCCSSPRCLHSPCTRGPFPRMWPQPGCWAALTHFDGAQLEVLARVIVDNGHEVIAQVALLVAAVLVPVLRGHQGGDVKDGCEAEWGQWSGHGMTPAGCWQGLLGWTGAAKIGGQQALCLSPGAPPVSPRGSERLQGPHLVPSQ